MYSSPTSPVITRRAFPLDSRTVWVEQVLVNESLVPKDNLPLGPGEYNSKILENHISTPSLGSRRVEHFSPFISRVSVRTPQDASHNISSSASMSQISSLATKNAFSPTRSDFTTIFHEHDIRQPLDPNRRFCVTPGSYCGPESLLRHVNTDGIQETKRIHFGSNTVPFGERNKYKMAGPTYDIKFDSLQVRPKLKFGPFLKSARVLKLGNECSDDRRTSTSPCSRSSQGSPSSFRNNNSEVKTFSNSYRAALVPLPKLKSKAPKPILFDASSYTNKHSRLDVHDLTPSYIKKEARIELFSSIVKIPRKHVSTPFESRIRRQLRDEV